MISEIYDLKAQRHMQTYNNLRDPQTVDDARKAIAAAIYGEEWARERASEYLKSMRLMQGKLSMLRHENNRLRAANERLKSRETESVTERERDAVIEACNELGAIGNGRPTSPRECLRLSDELRKLVKRLRP